MIARDAAAMLQWLDLGDWDEEPAITLLRTSYRTADVSVRERLTIGPDDLPAALAGIGRAVDGVVILATCNRFEVYLSGHVERADALRLVVEHGGIEHALADAHLGVEHGRAAIQHLHEVASGIDSMIVGEQQILGQVREALAYGTRARTADEPLSRLFHSAIRTGRQARAESGIAERAVSVPTVAAQQARTLHGDIASATVLVSGSGKAGRLAAEALASYGARHIMVANRTHARAEELAARVGGEAVPLAHIDEAVADADVLIAASAGPRHVVTAAQVAAAVERRGGRGMVIIDVAVPRSVDPAVRDVPGVRYRDMDDLMHIARENQRARASQIEVVRPIIDQGVERHLAWWREWRAVPVIAGITARAEAVRQAELAKTVRRMKPSDSDMEMLEALTQALVKQLLHQPIATLRERALHSDPAPLEAARALFQLDAFEGDPGSSADGTEEPGRRCPARRRRAAAAAALAAEATATR